MQDRVSRVVLDPGFVDARLDIIPWPIRVGSGGVSLEPLRRTEGGYRRVGSPARPEQGVGDKVSPLDAECS